MQNKLALHEKVLCLLFNEEDALTFFDIGACEGLSSVKYLSIFNKSRIFAFEPLPKNFNKVLANKEKYSLQNLFPFEIGLSDKKGEATFYVSSGKPENKDVPDDNSSDFGNKSSSLFKPGKTKEIHPWLKFKESITIQTDTLESFCKQENVNEIDFIHMDVQGAELMVLEGASSMISKVKALWLEVEKVALYENQALKNDIEKFLFDKGFVCVLNKVNHIAGDQFWVNKSYFDGLDKKSISQINKLTKVTALKSRVSTFFGSVKSKLK